MTTAQDVQVALLALDAYSRGTNPMLTDANNTPLATSIGPATWNYASDSKLLGSAASIYGQQSYL